MNNQNNETKKNNKVQKDEKGKRKKEHERNDINEKKLKEDLEYDIAEAMLLYYTNGGNKKSDTKRFVTYLNHLSKDNKSNNSFTNRAYGLYQYLTEQYSNFMDLDKIMNCK